MIVPTASRVVTLHAWYILLLVVADVASPVVAVGFQTHFFLAIASNQSLQSSIFEKKKAYSVSSYG